MLPFWIFEKKRKQKEQFIQDQLYIEELPFIEEKESNKEDEENGRGTIVIDLF